METTRVTQQNDACVEQSREIRILQEKIEQDIDMHLYSKFGLVKAQEKIMWRVWEDGIIYYIVFECAC